MLSRSDWRSVWETSWSKWSMKGEQWSHSSNLTQHVSFDWQRNSIYLGTLSRNFSRLSEWIWIITNLDSCLSCYYRLINLQMSWHPFQLRESTTVREKQEILDPHDCLFSFSPFNLSTFFITSLLMSISLTVCVARPGYTHNSFHPSTIQPSVTRLFCLWCVSVLLLLDLLCWVSQLRPDALLRPPLPSLPPPLLPLLGERSNWERKKSDIGVCTRPELSRPPESESSFDNFRYSIRLFLSLSPSCLFFPPLLCPSFSLTINNWFIV